MKRLRKLAISNVKVISVESNNDTQDVAFTITLDHDDFKSNDIIDYDFNGDVTLRKEIQTAQKQYLKSNIKSDDTFSMLTDYDMVEGLQDIDKKAYKLAIKKMEGKTLTPAENDIVIAAFDKYIDMIFGENDALFPSVVK